MADEPRKPSRLPYEQLAAEHFPEGTAARLRASLSRKIQDGVIAPGHWLREAALGAEYAVGRTIVRRALRMLADDGLVVIEENRGAYVAATTLHEVFDLYELRAALYGVAARFTCLRGSPAMIAETLAMIDTMFEALDKQDPADAVIALSEEIFTKMASVASADTRRMIEMVRRKTRWHFSYTALAQSPGGLGPIEHWRAVRAALVARDGDKAAAGARNILYYMQNEVMRMMASKGLGVQPAAGRLAGSGRRK